MTKIEVKIVKETKKAKLCEDAQGRQAWVQNRSYKDGFVNKKTFDKGVAWLVEQVKAKQAKAERLKGFVNLIHCIEGVTSSGKAEFLTLEFWEEYTDKRFVRKLFLPVSMKNEYGAYPAWFLEKKVDEIGNNLTDRYSGGCFVCEGTHEFFDNKIYA